MDVYRIYEQIIEISSLTSLSRPLDPFLFHQRRSPEHYYWRATRFSRKTKFPRYGQAYASEKEIKKRNKNENLHQPVFGKSVLSK